MEMQQRPDWVLEFDTRFDARLEAQARTMQALEARFKAQIEALQELWAGDHVWADVSVMALDHHA